MNMTDVLELLEAGIPFRELYRYLSNKHPNIDAEVLLRMVDTMYTEYHDAMESEY